jgi:hypothetical protein
MCWCHKGRCRGESVAPLDARRSPRADRRPARNASIYGPGDRLDAATAHAEAEFQRWCVAELERERAKLRKNTVAEGRRVFGDLKRSPSDEDKRNE